MTFASSFRKKLFTTLGAAALAMNMQGAAQEMRNIPASDYVTKSMSELIPSRSNLYKPSPLTENAINKTIVETEIRNQTANVQTTVVVDANKTVKSARSDAQCFVYAPKITVKDANGTDSVVRPITKKNDLYNVVLQDDSVVFGEVHKTTRVWMPEKRNPQIYAVADKDDIRRIGSMRGVTADDVKKYGVREGNESVLSLRYNERNCNGSQSHAFDVMYRVKDVASTDIVKSTVDVAPIDDVLSLPSGKSYASFPKASWNGSFSIAQPAARSLDNIIITDDSTNVAVPIIEMPIIEIIDENTMPRPYSFFADDVKDVAPTPTPIELAPEFAPAASYSSVTTIQLENILDTTLVESAPAPTPVELAPAFVPSVLYNTVEDAPAPTPIEMIPEPALVELAPDPTPVEMIPDPAPVTTIPTPTPVYSIKSLPEPRNYAQLAMGYSFKDSSLQGGLSLHMHRSMMALDLSGSTDAVTAEATYHVTPWRISDKARVDLGMEFAYGEANTVDNLKEKGMTMQLDTGVMFGTPQHSYAAFGPMFRMSRTDTYAGSISQSTESSSTFGLFARGQWMSDNENFTFDYNGRYDLDSRWNASASMSWNITTSALSFSPYVRVDAGNQTPAGLKLEKVDPKIGVGLRFTFK